MVLTSCVACAQVELGEMKILMEDVVHHEEVEKLTASQGEINSAKGTGATI